MPALTGLSGLSGLSAEMGPGITIIPNGLLNNLIAYWPGDEAAGDLLDAHTNGLDLADFNTVTNGAGIVYATARQYDNTVPEYHWRASHALLQTGDIDFTCAAWFRLDSNVGSYIIMAKDDVALGRDYTLDTNGADLRFYINGAAGGMAQTAGGILSTTWHLAIGWHDSVADKVWIQLDAGAPVSGNTGGAVPPSTAAVFGIGWRSFGGFSNPMDGRLGPSMFWKSAAGAGGALSDVLRAALYNAGAGVQYSAFTL